MNDREMSDSIDSPLVVGWREWISLPELALPAIKVKVDTGARTSAVHALEIEREVTAQGADLIHFTVLPLQRRDSLSVRCQAPLVDIRPVTDSGGSVEERFVVSTRLELGGLSRTIELTLTERPSMLFRMLLGRTALAGEMIVNPALSFACGRVQASQLYTASPGKRQFT